MRYIIVEGHRWTGVEIHSLWHVIPERPGLSIVIDHTFKGRVKNWVEPVTGGRSVGVGAKTIGMQGVLSIKCRLIMCSGRVQVGVMRKDGGLLRIGIIQTIGIIHRGKGRGNIGESVKIVVVVVVVG